MSWSGESKQGMNERYGMGEGSIVVDSEVLKSVEHSTLRWFGHLERMRDQECI